MERGGGPALLGPDRRRDVGGEGDVKPERSSGILLHPTSLPGRFGIGDFGGEAYRFVDFLAAAGQSLWQIMPLGPPGYGDSPYASTSAFAGNVNLVSPEALVETRLLADGDLQDTAGLPTGQVDFGKVIGFKRGLLEKAFANFKTQVARDGELRRDYERIRDQSAAWLDDYALFAALKDEYQGAEWRSWGDGLATH